VTGISAAMFATYKMKKFINFGAFAITFSHESASSTAANRIIVPGAVDLVVQPNESVGLYYDSTTARVRVV